MSKQSAILVVEFQKTWTERSFFHQLIKREYTRKKVLENTIQLLNKARGAGVRVIQSPLILDRANKEQYKQIPLPPKLLGQFTAGTWRAEYTDGIFHPSDGEVKGRTGFDNTLGSNLREILKEENIGTLYFSGFTTDHCVAETMETLEKEGIKCILISDCTATRNSSLQRKVEQRFTTIDSGQLVRKFQGF